MWIRDRSSTEAIWTNSPVEVELEGCKGIKLFKSSLRPSLNGLIAVSYTHLSFSIAI